MNLRYTLSIVGWQLQMYRHNLRVRFVKLRTGWYLWLWKVERYLTRAWR